MAMGMASRTQTRTCSGRHTSEPAVVNYSHHARRLNVVVQAVNANQAATEGRKAEATEQQGKCPMQSLRPLPPFRLNALQDFIMFWTDIYGWVDSVYKDGTVSQARFFGVKPAVYVADVHSARELLANEQSGKVVAGWPSAFSQLIGPESILVVSDPAKHKRLRQLITPALSSEVVESCLPEVQQVCGQELAAWAAQHAAGQTVSGYQGVKKLTFKVISKVIMDLDLKEHELSSMSQDFGILMQQLFTLLPFNVWPFPFYGAMQARQRLLDRLQVQVTSTRRDLAQSTQSRNRRSILQNLVLAKDEDGNSLTDIQVLDNLVMMLFAGHDTSSSNLSTLLLFLAKQPEVFQKLREEQKRIMAAHGPQITAAALKDMTYTSAVLQESLRINPPTLAVIRNTTQDVGAGGFLVPKDSFVLLDLWWIINHDDRWPETGSKETNPLHPSNFNPERFVSSSSSSSSSSSGSSEQEGVAAGGGGGGSQVPFGLGSRTCAGMALAQAEAKIFLATLARGYRLSADTDTKWIMRPIPRPANGLPVRLTPDPL